MKYLLVSILILVTTAVSASTDSGWREHRILVIGDSLIGGNSGFTAYLQESPVLAEATSVHVEAVIGARPSTFSKDNRLHRLIEEHEADRVIVVLGMNTLRSPLSVVRDSVKKLTDQLCGTECFWVGPPPLIEGAGTLLRKYPSYVSPCKYFDTSKEVQFPPSSVTGFHVKRWKSKRWARAFIDWSSRDGGTYGH